MRFLRPGLVLLLSTLAHAAIPQYEALRAARPDGRTVAVRDFALARDSFTFRFQEGTFHLLAPVEGTTFGAVFLGSGTYTLHPATEGERRHLGLITGEHDAEVLGDRFSELVLLFTDRTAEEIVGHAEPAQSAPDARARAAYETYLQNQKNTIQINLHLRVLTGLLNRPDREDGVFLASVDGERHAPALMVVDPLGISALAARLGWFGGEEVALLSVDGHDEGPWYLSAPANEASEGRGKPARRFADAEHYAIETTITRGAIEGKTTIRLRPLVHGLRVLPIHILPSLRIRKALVGATELEVIQEEIARGRIARLFQDEVADADAAVVFPEALVKGETVELTIEYEGSDVIHPTGEGFSVRARESWYPNLGSFMDLATYEMRYVYPKRQQLVSVGRLIDEREEGGNKVALWKAEKPIRIAGFNYGEFHKLSKTDPSNGVAFDVYTGKSWRRQADGAMADAMNTVRVGELFFGPVPYAPISVAQQAEWGFGQSWPSLVYLPPLALTTSTERAMELEIDPRARSAMNKFATTVGWHEIAHQWWGHQVGWAGYRDQWLSEGFAEFTSALVLQLTESAKHHEDFWEQKRRDIARVSDAGAITQGFRLRTRRVPEAAHTIVYSKGAYVLHMLRMLFRDGKTRNPDEKFIAMMRDFVTQYSDRNPSTDDFQTVVEKHMIPAMDAAGDRKMNWFFDQWVRGVEIPRLAGSLAASLEPGGKYRILGTISQEGVSDGFFTIVPIYLDFGRDGLVKVGTVRLKGSSSLPVDVELALPRAPERVKINAMHDVLTRD